jgi:hypothetical protein
MANGLCGEHHYANITQAKIDAIMDALKKNGATITGNNLWDVDTHNHGVKLRGTWNSTMLTLTIMVTNKNIYVPCSKIWDAIDPLINHISRLSDKDVA